MKWLYKKHYPGFQKSKDTPLDFNGAIKINVWKVSNTWSTFLNFAQGVCRRWIFFFLEK